jgi:hypothetical protein
MPKTEKKEIDWERAFKLAALCHSTKHNSGYYCNWFSYDKCLFIEDSLTDTEMYCFADGKEICIIFRGSDSIIDWFWNVLAVKKHKNEFGKVHSGFHFATYRLLHNKKFIDFIEKNPGEIYIAGHSKGGAMATVMAPYLFRVKAIYAFGVPRVGNWDYSKNYPMKDRLFMFRNKWDCIFHLPPLWFFYKHVDGHFYKFDSGKHAVGEYLKNTSEVLYEMRRKNEIDNIKRYSQST